MLFSNQNGYFKSDVFDFFVRVGTLHIAESLQFPVLGYK